MLRRVRGLTILSLSDMISTSDRLISPLVQREEEVWVDKELPTIPSMSFETLSAAELQMLKCFADRGSQFGSPRISAW